MFRSRQGTSGHVGRIVATKARHAGVYRVQPNHGNRTIRVAAARIQGWWPKGSSNHSIANLRPLEATGSNSLLSNSGPLSSGYPARSVSS